MGLERMRKQNRMRSRGKHYPFAHETNTNISLNQIKQGHTIGLELSLQKCLDYTIYMVEYYY